MLLCWQCDHHQVARLAIWGNPIWDEDKKWNFQQFMTEVQRMQQKQQHKQPGQHKGTSSKKGGGGGGAASIKHEEVKKSESGSGASNQPNPSSSASSSSGSNQQQQQQQQQQQDKRFKTLPPSESLPRSEIPGGYIFVCNNDTMQEDLKRQLFGLPQRYRDSVRTIQPGLPLFLYNYSTHQLHGIYEATSFGGSNIDATAWEDKKCPGESRFPAQVRVKVRRACKPLEENSFRPILYHYDGPKFRLQLSVPETLKLLDLFEMNEEVGSDTSQQNGT